jgi:chorismate mutase
MIYRAFYFKDDLSGDQPNLRELSTEISANQNSAIKAISITDYSIVNDNHRLTGFFENGDALNLILAGFDFFNPVHLQLFVELKSSGRDNNILFACYGSSYTIKIIHACKLGFDGVVFDSEKAGEEYLPVCMEAANYIRERKQVDMELEFIAIRNKINDLDSKMAGILHERMDLVKKLAHLKSAHHSPIFQGDRWNEIKYRFIEQSGLNKKLSVPVINSIHIAAILQHFDSYNIEKE